MKNILLMTSLLALTACGGSVGSITNPSFDRTIPISLVNATDKQVSFYLRDNIGKVDNKDLFKSKYLSERIEANSDSLHIKYKNNSLKPEIWLGVADTATGNNQDKDNKKVSQDDELWAIAWQSGDDVRSDIFEKKTSNKDGYFRIRFLSTQTTKISINSHTHYYLQADDISDFFSLDSCSDSLLINDQPADICNATQGYSYLAIIDKDSVIKYVQED